MGSRRRQTAAPNHPSFAQHPGKSNDRSICEKSLGPYPNKQGDNRESSASRARRLVRRANGQRWSSFPAVRATLTLVSSMWSAILVRVRRCRATSVRTFFGLPRAWGRPGDSG